MKIPSHQLAAFFETAQARSFSKAAKRLGVTQSALSQRISHLENELETTLFIREAGGPRLTEAGELMLRFCQVQGSLEQEVLSKLQKSGTAYAGVVRVAGFSSVMRSVLMPALADFLRANPAVHCEFRSFEMGELFEVLRNAEADFVVLDYHLEKSGIQEYVLGREEYVVIESQQYASAPDIYLDHGPQDDATEAFFRTQPGAPKKYQRSFMGDVYGIISGVELGLGRAVMSKHLLKGNKKVKEVGSYKKYYREITLNHFAQPYYSELHQKVVQVLRAECGKFL
ncbi:MAG: LysR family transcriptional regulator [Bdellovibrionota bacterium]